MKPWDAHFRHLRKEIPLFECNVSGKYFITEKKKGTRSSDIVLQAFQVIAVFVRDLMYGMHPGLVQPRYIQRTWHSSGGALGVAGADPCFIVGADVCNTTIRRGWESCTVCFVIFAILSASFFLEMLHLAVIRAHGL